MAASIDCSNRLREAISAATGVGKEAVVRACVVAPWPEESGQSLVAVAYEPLSSLKEPERFRLPLHVLLIKDDTMDVLMSYQSDIDEDAVTHVTPYSLRFDTARYRLTERIRAFGLRISAAVDPRFSEGGSDDALTLYVIDEGKIRPVLNRLPMTTWRYVDGFSGDAARHKKTSTYTLSLSPRRSHGWADLLLVAKTTGSKRTFTHTLHYNGRLYPFDRIDLEIKLSGNR